MNLYDQILKIVLETIQSLPKEISADIYNNGVMFVGGASCIAGLYEYAKKKLDLPIIIQESPMDSVILGAGKLLSSEKKFLKINL